MVKPGTKDLSLRATPRLEWETLFRIAQETRAAGGSLVPSTDRAKEIQLLTEMRDGIKTLAPGAKPVVLVPPPPAGRGGG